MLAALALLTTAAATIASDDEPASPEERFRLLYGLGEKYAAFACLPEEIQSELYEKMQDDLDNAETLDELMAKLEDVYPLTEALGLYPIGPLQDNWEKFRELPRPELRQPAVPIEGIAWMRLAWDKDRVLAIRPGWGTSGYTPIRLTDHPLRIFSRSIFMADAGPELFSVADAKTANQSLATYFDLEENDETFRFYENFWSLKDEIQGQIKAIPGELRLAFEWIDKKSEHHNETFEYDVNTVIGLIQELTAASLKKGKSRVARAVDMQDDWRYDTEDYGD